MSNVRRLDSRSLSLAHLQVDDSVCAMALHRVKLQVPLEVFGIETGDGQTIAKAGLYRQREGTSRN